MIREDTQFLRGGRLLTIINEAMAEFHQLNEMTYAELESKTLGFSPSSQKRQNATNEVQIANMQLVPYVESHALEVHATVNSNGNRYEPLILFKEVNYDQTDQQDNISFTGSDGKDHFIKPIDLSQSNVEVRCTCLDFYWRFAAYNSGSSALYGNAPPRYVRRTQTRPPANAKRTPGLCKHLIKVAIDLHEANIVTS